MFNVVGYIRQSRPVVVVTVVVIRFEYLEKTNKNNPNRQPRWQLLFDVIGPVAF